MFPIRDHNPSGRVPFVTYLLIAANILVFFSYAGALNDARVINALYSDYALFPERISAGYGWSGLITSQFLHAGWMHLIGNMLFLFIFGDNIEDVLGPVRYLCFYLLAGVAAGLTQVLSGPFSAVPMVGASGAIAGVMGAYLLFYPKAKIDIFVFFLVFFRIFPIPAWIMLMIWFGMQFFGGLGAHADEGGTAYWAHAGGFVAGAILILPFWLKRGAARYWDRTEGHPPHPEARYPILESRLPKVRRK